MMRKVFWIVIVVLLVGGFILYTHLTKQDLNTPLETSNTMSATIDGTRLPAPQKIAEFTLTDDTDKPFTNENLKGHWTVLYFGFTHCADICPTTLTELNKAYLELQKKLPEKNIPQIVMVTVDPDRDTTEVMHHYVKDFNPHFIGARANEKDLAMFSKTIGLTYQATPKKSDGSYAVHHSPQLFIINPDGDWVGSLNYPHKAVDIDKDYLLMISDQRV